MVRRAEQGTRAGRVVSLEVDHLRGLAWLRLADIVCGEQGHDWKPLSTVKGEAVVRRCLRCGWLDLDATDEAAARLFGGDMDWLTEANQIGRRAEYLAADHTEL